MTGSAGGSPGLALRIGLVAPPLLPVPPPTYGGTERVVHALAEGLHRLGHDVTLFASADSEVSCRLVATVPRACWTGGSPDVAGSFERVLDAVARQDSRFDVIHSHLETIRRFSAARMVDEYLAVYRRLLDGGGSRPRSVTWRQVVPQ